MSIEKITLLQIFSQERMRYECPMLMTILIGISVHLRSTEVPSQPLSHIHWHQHRVIYTARVKCRPCVEFYLTLEAYWTAFDDICAQCRANNVIRKGRALECLPF